MRKISSEQEHVNGEMNRLPPNDHASAAAVQKVGWIERYGRKHISD
jgi:hypothetical protein